MSNEIFLNFRSEPYRSPSWRTSVQHLRMLASRSNYTTIFFYTLAICLCRLFVCLGCGTMCIFMLKITFNLDSSENRQNRTGFHWVKKTWSQQAIIDSRWQPFKLKSCKARLPAGILGTDVNLRCEILMTSSRRDRESGWIGVCPSA